MICGRRWFRIAEVDTSLVKVSKSFVSLVMLSFLAVMMVFLLCFRFAGNKVPKLFVGGGVGDVVFYTQVAYLLAALASVTFEAAAACGFSACIRVGISGRCGCAITEGGEYILVLPAVVVLDVGDSGVSVSTSAYLCVKEPNHSW